MQASKSFAVRFALDALASVFITEVGLDSSVGLDKVSGANFKKNLAKEVQVIFRKAIGGTYKFTNYRQLLITKGAEKLPRELCIPTIRDKVTLKALSKVLEDVFEDKCSTPQPQPIIQALAMDLQGGKYDSFIKFDIRRFYATVDHQKLLRILRRKIRKKEILSLIRKAISTPSAAMGVGTRKKRVRGLPEGLPISNKLANIYVEDIDAMFKADRKIKYYRYVDDIIVLCHSADIDRVKKQMKAAVRRLSLELHPDSADKSQSGWTRKDAFEYLGYTFTQKGLAPRNQSILSLEKWLDSHMRDRRSTSNLCYWEWKLRLRITGCRITEDGMSFNRFGWLFYFSQSTDAVIPHKLDALLAKLANRYDVDLPADLPTFSKSYYEIHYRNGESPYIELIDLTVDVSEKRRILSQLYGDDYASKLTDEDIGLVFNRRMLNEAKSLERDIGAVS